MKKIDVVRFWKDESYRESVNARGEHVTANPAGSVDLSEDVLTTVSGAAPTPSTNSRCQDLHACCCVAK